MNLKIVIVEPFGNSGIAYYTNSLVTALSGTHSKSQFDVITSKECLIKSTNENVSILPILEGMNKNEFRLVRFLKATINPLKVILFCLKKRPHVIHLQSSFIPPLDLVYLLVLKFYKIKIVFTAHEVDFSNNFDKESFYTRFISNNFKFIYRLSNLIIVHSLNSKIELLNKYGVPESKIIKINHGIQNYHLSAKINDDSINDMLLNIPNSSTIGLFFGSLRSSKGLSVLLYAMPKVLMNCPNFHLIIAGASHYSIDPQEYITLSLSLKINTNVHFIIKYLTEEEVSYLFKKVSFVILPYQKIYQSGVLATAFAFGKTVISSNVGGLIEIVEDGVNGLIVNEVNNPQLYADKIIELYNDKELLHKLTNGVKETAATLLSWDKIAKETFEVYCIESNRVLQ